MMCRAAGAVLSMSVTSIFVLTGSGVVAAEPVSLDHAVSAAMVATKADDTAVRYGVSTPAGLEPLVEPKRSTGDWVFGGSVFPVPDGVEAAPVTSLFFAERAADGSWHVALEGSEDFTRLVHEAPDALFVDDGERAALAATARPAGPAGPPGWPCPGVGAKVVGCTTGCTAPSARTVALDGRTVGGWTWHEEPGVNQSGYGERRGRELSREECCLTNHGAHG